MRAWWRGNDGRRRGVESVLSETERENLLALNKLLDESDDTDRLMQAEIMRKLGDLENALESLREPFDALSQFGDARGIQFRYALTG
jgi:hypothetical protein